MHASLTALNIYPVKSCHGIPLHSAQVTDTGLVDDRHWMLVRPNGRFVTQRELPRLALIGTAVEPDRLPLTAPGMSSISVARGASCTALPVTVWKFTGDGLDCGDEIAQW